MNPRPQPRVIPPAEIPVYSRLPIEIVEGAGRTVVDREGRRYLDLYGGHAVAALGHGHPVLVEAIIEQSRALLFQTNAVELPVRREAVQRLVDFAPEGLCQAFLVNSGAEANENALRMAFRATGRSAVVALEQGFHGRTAAAAACTHGSEAWYGYPTAPFQRRFVAPNDMDALEQALDEDCAALIVEAVQGVAGARDLDASFLQAARTITQQRGILLIADEVQCGVGRCGSRFAIEAAGVVPDLMTCAKGLGGGVPVGAVLATESVAAPLGVGDLGTTFGGGPLACAAINAVLSVVDDPLFLSHVQECEDWIRRHCVVGPVRAIQGRGLLLGLRVDRPARDVLADLRQQGILAGSAADPQIVRLMPPLTVTLAELEQLRDALESIQEPAR